MANDSIEVKKDDPQLAMAAERTMLAWIRTGLSMMGFGFVVARFGLFLREIAVAQKLPSRTSVHLSVWLGTLLVAVGVVALLATARSHFIYLRNLSQGIVEMPSKRSLGVAIGLSLAALGAAMVAYLVILAVTG